VLQTLCADTPTLAMAEDWLLTWHQWFEVDKSKTQWACYKDLAGLYGMGSEGVLQGHTPCG
jgi:hypothetical protein